VSDPQLEGVVIQRKAFFKIARNASEYVRDIVPSEELLQKLHMRRVDIFTFLERKWCFRIPNPQKNWAKAEDNIALIQTPNFADWLTHVGKKTRNMIRKAEKSGINTRTATSNEELAQGIWKIFNETSIRQERGFPHYGMPLETVRKLVLSQPNCTFIGAYFQNELAGFVQLVHGDNMVIISQILSLQRYRDKAVNNALIAKVMEFSAANNVKWIMYGRIGNHPSLDTFKQNNGFTRFILTRYYIPLTKKGTIAVKLGLHREIKDSLPQSIKQPLIPLYNWISRTKTRMRLRLQRKKVS